MAGTENDLNEPRDWHGRWTSGDGADAELAQAPPDQDRRAADIANATVGALPKAVRARYESWLRTRGGLELLRKLIPAWTEGAGFDDAAFARRYFRPYADSRTALAAHAMARLLAASRNGPAPAEATEQLAAMVAATGMDNWHGSMIDARNLADHDTAQRQAQLAVESDHAGKLAARAKWKPVASEEFMSQITNPAGRSISTIEMFQV